MINDEIEDLEVYVKAARACIPLYRELGEALETKKILTYADRIEVRIKDLGTIKDRLEDLPKLADAFEREVKPKQPLKAKDLRSIPSYTRLSEAVRAIDKLVEKVIQQDEGGFIDWSLDDFISHDVPVVRELADLSPDGNLIEGLVMQEVFRDFVGSFLED